MTIERLVQWAGDLTDYLADDLSSIKAAYYNLKKQNRELMTTIEELKAKLTALDASVKLLIAEAQTKPDLDAVAAQVDAIQTEINAAFPPAAPAA